MDGSLDAWIREHVTPTRAAERIAERIVFDVEFAVVLRRALRHARGFRP